MRASSRTKVVRLGAVAAALGSAAAVASACGARSGLDIPIVKVGLDGGLLRDGTVPLDGGFLPGRDATVGREVGPPPAGLDCAEAGVTYIYVIALDNSLYAFHPDVGEFDLIGVIDCPAPEGASPFSMAVDHDGVAYVVFSHEQQVGENETVSLPGDGELFRVSTANASCEPTAFVPGQRGFYDFGMGFVANMTAGGVAGETLYVAGDQGNDNLASIDLTTFTLTPVAPLGSLDGVQVRFAELTGTGGGNLYGFFASTEADGGLGYDTPPSYIAHLSPQTGNVLGLVELPDVAEGDAWAFGFWGGDFYTFTVPCPDAVCTNTSVVTRYRPADGSIVQVARAPFGVEIVGAGVSTCAPQE